MILLFELGQMNVNAPFVTTDMSVVADEWMTPLTQSISVDRQT